MKKQKAKVHRLENPNAGILKKARLSGRLYLSIEDFLHDFHLYFTSNEEIKEGDWILYMIHCKEPKTFNGQPTVTKYNPIVHINKCDCIKIVATTNPELWEIKHWDCNGRGCDVCNVPFAHKIDTSFIEDYIKAYNEGKPLEEVLLETEEVYQPYEEPKGIYNKNATKTHLKLKSDGSVIVTPVKEIKITWDFIKNHFGNEASFNRCLDSLAFNNKKQRMYPREALRKAAYTAWLKGKNESESWKEYIKGFEDWFNKNYPE